MAKPPPPKLAVDRAIANVLFRSRWLLAPIYLGLVLTLAGLAVVFASELIQGIRQLLSVHPHYVLLTTLSMIDLSLAANLVLIVIFSGYEQFIGRIDSGEEERLSWMGAVDFGGLKVRLIASLVAISAVALLRAFLLIADGEGAPDNRTLAWLVGIHLTFVVSGLLLALMDFVVAKTPKH
jgi:uncharacterized protein (TIGR00645 family)